MDSVAHVAVCRSFRSRRSGFALVLALGVMAFLAMLVLCLATMARIGNKLASGHQSLAFARQNALFSLELALAHLESAAGPDQRVTASAELTGNAAPGALHWTGVWDYTAASIPEPSWLVSGNEKPATFRAPDDSESLESGSAIWILWKHAVNHSDDYVGVPLVELPRDESQGAAPTIGRYAYWVSDEGGKASVQAIDRVSSVFPGFAGQQIRQRANPAHQPSALISDWVNHNPRMREEMAMLLSPYQLPVLLPEWANAIWRDRRHDLTPQSLGLLTNADPETGGGLRLNLADRPDGVGGGRFDDPFASGAVLRAWEEFPARDAQGRLPLTLLSSERFDTLEAGEPYVFVAPILTEAVLKVAVFHHQQRGEPAIRYAIEAEFLNPFTAPLILRNDDRRALTVSVEDLPAINITNQTTGASTGPLPIDEMPGSSGRPGVTSYMEFDPAPGGNTTGVAMLHEGETYRLREPDAGVQPEGLVKYTGIELSVENGHEILVALDHPAGESGIRFGLHRGIDSQEEPFWQIRNLPYDRSAHLFHSPLNNGARPYLINSTDVEVETTSVFEFHYALGFGDWEDERRLGDWRDGFDLRVPAIDHTGTWSSNDGRTHFNREFIRFSGGHVAEPERRLNDLFSVRDWIHDEVPRDSTEGRYTDLRLYDVPQGKPITLADFRLLPFKDLPPRGLGSPLGGLLNKSFDRYFLSTVPEGWERDVESQPSAIVFPNSRLKLASTFAEDAPTAVELRAEDAARHFRLRGAFNWNSTRVEAWRAVLSLAFTTEQGWFYLKPDGAIDSLPIEHAIFRHPFGAPAAGKPLSDAEFRHGGESESIIRRAHFRQGVRRIDDDDLSRLAEAIVVEIQRHGRPFPSLAVFINEGVFERALNESGINAGFPRHANGHISQSDLVALLSLGAAIRSDTFCIRAYGDVFNPLTRRVEGRAALEAIVQRTVDYLDPDVDPGLLSSLPRRFEVVAFRWLAVDREL